MAVDDSFARACAACRRLKKRVKFLEEELKKEDLKKKKLFVISLADALPEEPPEFSPISRHAELVVELENVFVDDEANAGSSTVPSPQPVPDLLPVVIDGVDKTKTWICDFETDMPIGAAALAGEWESDSGLVTIEWEMSELVFKEKFSDGTMAFGVLRRERNARTEVHHIFDVPDPSLQCHQENYIGLLEFRWPRCSIHGKEQLMETRIMMHNDEGWGDVVRYMRRQ